MPTSVKEKTNIISLPCAAVMSSMENIWHSLCTHVYISILTFVHIFSFQLPHYLPMEYTAFI